MGKEIDQAIIYDPTTGSFNLNPSINLPPVQQSVSFFSWFLPGGGRWLAVCLVVFSIATFTSLFICFTLSSPNKWLKNGICLIFYYIWSQNTANSNATEWKTNKAQTENKLRTSLGRRYGFGQNNSFYYIFSFPSNTGFWVFDSVLK